mgnify:CR=1 FL=1
MAYLELVKPELLIALGILFVGFIGLGLYAIHFDKKHGNDSHNLGH